MAEDIDSDNKPNVEEEFCCCKSFFTKANILKFILTIVVIILSCFAFNQINKWLTYRKIEKLANTMVMHVGFNDFGGIFMNSRFDHITSRAQDINNKMLLYYLIKQQNEIIKNQKGIEKRLDKLSRGNVSSESISSNHTDLSPETPETLASKTILQQPKESIKPAQIAPESGVQIPITEEIKR